MAYNSQWGNAIASDLQRDLGLTKEQALGVVGGLAAESGGFTTFHETLANGKPGPGIGMAQWTDKPRKDGFLEYAKNNGGVYSYEANYGYLVKELKSTEANALRKLKEQDTVAGAEAAFSRFYERPGTLNPKTRTANQIAAEKARRAQIAAVAESNYTYVPPGNIPTDVPDTGGAVRAYTSSGEGVQRLQSELKRMGFDPGEVDGVMGSRTKSAIKEFQKANGLTADGIVGPQTATVLSAMGGGNVSVPGSQNWRNVSGVAPAGVSISPGYNPNVGIGDIGNAAMSVTPRVPFEANFRDPADPILNNISPERAKMMSRGLDMNVSREQSAKDVLIGGFGALLGKTFPMGSASAAPVANTNLSTLRRQIGFTDASRVAPAVPAPKPRPAAPVATPYLPGMTLPRPASFPATTNTVRTDGTVVSGVGGAGQVRTSQIPEGYRPASALPYTPASIFSAPLRLTGPGGMTGTSPPKFIPPVYSSASPSTPIPLPRTARPVSRTAIPLPKPAPLSFAAIKPAPTAPTKLTGFGGMTGTSFPSAAPIPLPRNARPVAPAGTAVAATEKVAGLKPASNNVSSYSGGSSSRSGSSSPAPIEGSATGRLYNVGQTYTTGGGLKYVAQADGSFKKKV